MKITIELSDAKRNDLAQGSRDVMHALGRMFAQTAQWVVPQYIVKVQNIARPNDYYISLFEGTAGADIRIAPEDYAKVAAMIMFLGYGNLIRKSIDGRVVEWQLSDAFFAEYAKLAGKHL